MSNLGNKEIMGQNIERQMKLHGIDRKQLSEALDVPYTTLTDWINGKTYPRIDRIEQMARYFSIPKRELVEEWAPSRPTIPPGLSPMPKMKKVPLLGTIPCGDPQLAIEQADEFADMPEDVHADFSLRCQGDSMINARIFDGDIVFIRLQPEVASGEIAAVRTDGEDATLKRVHFVYGRRDVLVAIELRAENPSVGTRRFDGEEMSSVEIIGKAVAFTSLVK